MASTNDRRVNPDFPTYVSYHSYNGRYYFLWRGKKQLPSSDDVDKWAHVKVPRNHSTFISLPFFFLSSSVSLLKILELSAYSQYNPAMPPLRRWTFISARQTDLPVVVDAALLEVHVQLQYVHRTDAFVMAFSFIEVRGRESLGFHSIHRSLSRRGCLFVGWLLSVPATC